MKKVTMLFGAGAALPWKAPSTNSITNAINNCPDQMVNGKTLGVWIKEQIQNTNKRNNKNINFETYVDFLESVYYFLNEENFINVPAINLSGIFEVKQEIMEGIKNISFQNNSTFPSESAKISSCFYSLIRIIGNEIRKYYSNYNDGDNLLNWKFKYFIEHFIKIGYSVRAYTLNYDRSVPTIFEGMSSQYEIFDGFDVQEHEARTKDLFFCNKERVLNDSHCHSFYNLHGSFHWSFQDCEYKTTNGSLPFILMSSKTHNPPASEFIDIESYSLNSNPNERLLQTKIITGYRKMQRINLEPFNYFFHNFFRDIHQSEIIIVIGYSFSDPHINQLLKDAIRRRARIYNITFRVIINEKGYSYTGFEGLVLRNSYPTITNWFRDVEFFYSDYPNGFEKFLSDEEWFNIQPI